jgi:sodium-independent sulfate anion transporter 11
MGNTFPTTVSYRLRVEDSKLNKVQYHLCSVVAEGKAIDATQEMIAIGMCNILSSFVISMLVSGALSHGAVNHASGVETTFGGVYTGM